MKINDKNGLGKIEVRTLKLPEFVIKPFATYLFTGQVLIFFEKQGDPKSEEFIRMATLNDDGSDFKEVFAGEIKRVGTSNGIRHMPFTDNKRVLLGDYILECEPSIIDCKKTKVVPIRYPWNIASDSKYWMHWSEIIVAPDNEHMAWTSLLKSGGCTVVVGKLVREKDEYVIKNTQVINPSSSFVKDESRKGYIIPQFSRGGEVKQFVKGGTAISAVGAGISSALPDSIVQDLLSDSSVQITKLPCYEETTMFSP